jgi:hypothetical protein
MRQRRLQWFEHVKRDQEQGLLRIVEQMEVSGKKPVGRPKVTWRKTVQRDMEELGIDESLASDGTRLRSAIVSHTPNKRE